MPNNYDAQDAKCPFYKKDENRRILCEGIIKNSVIVQIFNKNADKHIHKAKYCNNIRHYEDCPLYSMIAQKYDK